MLSNFQVSIKTCRPACCNFDCCGNKFGRICGRSGFANYHGMNRIIKTRRYAKHVEAMKLRREIELEILAYQDSIREVESAADNGGYDSIGYEPYDSTSDPYACYGSEDI